MLSIKKLNSVPVPNGLGKYLPEMLYFVKQSNTVSIYLTDTTGDGLYQVVTGSGGGSAMTSYFIAKNAVLPSNLSPGDFVIETTTGDATGKAIRVWVKQSNGSVVLVSGSRRVVDGAQSNLIGNSAQATVNNGLYIVPSTGLSGAFVSHANQLAVFNGSTFFFTDPDAGATYYILSGDNEGQYWTWTGTEWVHDVSYAPLTVLHWDLSLSWKAGDIAIKNGNTYVANGNIASGTSFALGVTGATWKTLSTYVNAANRIGESVLGNTVRLVSTVPATVMTITLPEKGVWKVDSFVRMMTDQGVELANGGSFALYDDTNTVIPNSEVKAIHGTPPEGFQTTACGRSIITTTGSKVITMKAWLNGNAGQPWIKSDNQGRTKITFEKIADE